RAPVRRSSASPPAAKTTAIRCCSIPTRTTTLSTSSRSKEREATMELLKVRAAALTALAALALAACGANGSLPSSAAAGAGAGAAPFAISQGAIDRPDDTTSILKKLTKDVVIGSTVDPGNGDTGPHSLAIVKTSYGLKKGQVVVCNFADASGTAGNGTTVEVLNPTPGS